MLARHLWGHQPGVYSDIGYLTAARWIETVTARSLWHSVRDCLCDVLPGLIETQAVMPSPSTASVRDRVVRSEHEYRQGGGVGD